MPAPGSELAATRQSVKDHRSRLKKFLMAYSEAISVGRKSREVVHQGFQKVCAYRGPKADRFYLQSAISREHTRKTLSGEDAVQVALEDLSPTIPKLKEMKVADFIDITPMKEFENEGFVERTLK
jgi:hypothetical protein